MRSDDDVCSTAIATAIQNGGFLTFVAVVGDLWPKFDCGPLAGWCVTNDYLREHARSSVSRAGSRVPTSIPVRVVIDEGNVPRVVARRVEVGAHDLVVLREGWMARFRLRRMNVPIVYVAQTAGDRRPSDVAVFHLSG